VAVNEPEVTQLLDALHPLLELEGLETSGDGGVGVVAGCAAIVGEGLRNLAALHAVGGDGSQSGSDGDRRAGMRSGGLGMAAASAEATTEGAAAGPPPLRLLAAKAEVASTKELYPPLFGP